MKTRLKRVLSLALTALMLLMLVPGAFASEIVTSEPVIPGLGVEKAAEPEKSAADALFERLMACTTYDEFDAIINALTDEETALLDELTAEQNAALEAKVAELGGYDADVLANGVLSVTNTMTYVDVVYYKIENGATTSDSPVTVTSDAAVETTLPSTSDAIVFFIKPKPGYLLTQFYRSDNTSSDLYSTEVAAESCYFGFFRNNSKVGNEILKKAKSGGYLGYYGFTGTLQNDYSAPFVEVAEAPQMTIKAVAEPNENLKPGDRVTFTITVTPGALTSGLDYTITETTITSLTINGVSYTATKNANGTYSVDYVITEADWAAKKATLDVTASLTYDYELPVKDRYATEGKIRTTATIESSATTDCNFATKTGVLYRLSYDAPDSVNPPLNTTLADYIPAAPIDNGEYFDGADVTVKDYDRSDVDDPANKGTWTFTGWKNGDKDNYTADDKVSMPEGGLLFTGVWKFEPYPNYNLTVKKTLSGNMYDASKTFAFTVSADKDMTYGDASGKSFTFNLGKDGQAVISVPVGATVTVTEDPAGYEHSVGAGTTISKDDYTTVENGYGISFIMPANGATVVFNNEKNITIDTGVMMDSLPYILILAVVVAVGVIVFIRKRRGRDDD